MKLVAGSYERFLWGWQVKEKKKELQWTFSYPAHIGPIKCIASSGSVVATGGADDTIKIFDLNAKKDMGSLYKHEGAVTCLDFHGSHPTLDHPTHLLSGSEDGTICIWDTDSWIHLTTMKTKKGPRTAVNDLSIHPSGLLALSVERNSHMKMWNLTKGRCSFTTKLASEAAIVKFFPQAGESYALVLGTVLEVRNAETGSTIHSLQHDKRVFCMAQQQDNLLVTGGEDSIVRAWDTRSGKQAWSVANAHTNRIKGVAILGSSSEAGNDELPSLVASASSDGTVKVWDTRMVGSEGEEAPVPVMQAETKARLTCLVTCSGTKRSVRPESESVTEDQGVATEEPSSPGAALSTHRKKNPESKKKRKIASMVGDARGEEDESPGKRQKPNSAKAKKKKKANSKPEIGGSHVRTPPAGTKPPGSKSPGTKSPANRKRLGAGEKTQDSDAGTPSKNSSHKKRKPNSAQKLPSKFSKSQEHGSGPHSKSPKKKRKLQSKVGMT